MFCQPRHRLAGSQGFTSNMCCTRGVLQRSFRAERIHIESLVVAQSFNAETVHVEVLDFRYVGFRIQVYQVAW